MKRILICLLIGVLCSLPVAQAFAEEPAVTRIELSDCDTNETMREEHRNAVVPDESNYVGGEASLMVTSILPNILLPFESAVDASAIDPETGYFECYFYFDDPTLYDFSSAYSFIKLTSETPDDQRTQANSFVWSTAPLKQVQPGWNYVALKLSAATFTGPKTQEEVLSELNGFFFIIWSVQKPDAPGTDLTGDNYYTLKANLDSLSIASEPETFEDFDFTYHQRMEEIQMRPQAVYVKDGTEHALRITAFVLFGIAFAGFVGTELFLMLRRKTR